MDIQEEKKRGHEKHFAVLEHKETLKKLKFDRDKDNKAQEGTCIKCHFIINRCHW